MKHIRIPLNGHGGQYEAIISEQDYELVSQYRWQAVKIKHYVYARAYAEGRTKSGYRRCLYMHRLIMNPPADLMVDHKDHDTLNNTRENLRPATRAQNAQNSLNRKPAKFRGVSNERGGTWRCFIRLNGRSLSLGTFTSQEAAALAYDAAARLYHGEFATLNFPDFEVTRLCPMPKRKPRKPKAANSNVDSQTIGGAA